MVASAPFTTGHVMDKEFKASGSYSSKGNSGKLTPRPSLNSRGVLTSCVAQIISMIHTLLCPETHKTLFITPIHKYINDYLRRSAGPNRYQKLAGIVFLESKALRSPGWPRSAHYNFSTVPSHLRRSHCLVYHYNHTTILPNASHTRLQEYPHSLRNNAFAIKYLIMLITANICCLYEPIDHHVLPHPLFNETINLTFHQMEFLRDVLPAA